MSEANGRISSLGTVGAFLKKGACSETLLYVLNRAYGHPMTTEEHASGPLAGGIMMHGYQCGQTWGAALAAGAQAYRRFGAGADAQARAMNAARRALDAFREQNSHTDCFDITEMNQPKLRFIAHFVRRGGPALCLGMAARYAPMAYRAINAALAEEAIDVPPAPVSCAALLAQKMGASDVHTVMAAGLAGGIGLSGGACGALAAAVWLTGINTLEKSAARLTLKPPDGLALIDRFLPCTNYQFECATIVGRKFESVADHARHVCEGGCSRIVAALSAA